ncbi:MAG TPA: TatD family hydrolase [Candidatus Paceibacterota bacterium]|nr:TatD family hydrolase [Candidatus Paceibacterota bacterium]
MEVRVFDIHSHIYYPDFDVDRAEMLSDMQEKGVGTIVIGTDVESSMKAIELCDANAARFACIGIHPLEASEMNEEDVRKSIVELEQIALDQQYSEKVVAIGETGLDYFRITGTNEEIERVKAIQKQLFLSQARIAASAGLPLMIHCRDAHADLLKIYKEEGLTAHLHFHFFAVTSEILKECLDMGATVSFTGVITFAPQYKELVEQVPLDRFMIETDAPYAAPAPFRGKRADPRMVMQVAEAFSEIRGIPLEEVLRKSTENTLKYFPRISEALSKIK